MLTKRQLDVLQYLMEQNDYVKVEDLKSKYNVSNRTVRHDLLLLEDWLLKYQIRLERNRKKGVKLPLTEKQMKLLLQETQNKPLFFHNKERNKMIIKALIEESFVSSDVIQEELQVSKSTFLQDLKQVKKWLNEKGLNFVRNKGDIQLIGNERMVRAAYIDLLREQFNDQHIFQLFIRGEGSEVLVSPWKEWFPLEDIYEISQLLHHLEEKLSLQFSDSSFSALSLHLLMAVQRLKEGHLIQMDQELLNELKNKTEFSKVKALILEPLQLLFHVKTPEEEIAYITQHVLGAQREKESDDEEDDFYRDLALEIMKNVEQRYNQKLMNQDKIMDGLSIHLKPAFYRAKYNLQTKNPLKDQIEKIHGALIQMIDEETNRVLEPFHIRFDRDEICYIALHIISGMTQPVLPLKYKIGIVCSSGLGTSTLLEQRMATLYPQIISIKKYSYKEIMNATSFMEDLILTTIDLPIQNQIPVIKVSPLLTKEDILKLTPYIGEPHQAMHEEGMLMQVMNNIMSIIENHAIINDEKGLTRDLLHFFQGNQSTNQDKELSQLLSSKNIALQKELRSWQECIQYGNQLLIQSNCTSIDYGHYLVKLAEQPQNHFVIAEGVAFPHATSDAVIQTGLSLVTLKKPLVFGASKKKVWLIATLAATDRTQHIKALSTLLELLSDPLFMSKLKYETNPQNIWKEIVKKEGEKG
ncbi:BglG family transcription antiterminator [Alkalihalobacillus trypoxylicola]|uniref:BglG family transcription antiterminator n=1 Tax=Alkalihalobacillus trypoxylicola TaxID=519424 RepID=UPI0007823070|nr:BglG family transcription antiterminator [Alkalihalobacillus trypoxylicola]